jgi:hypothetical protein
MIVKLSAIKSKKCINQTSELKYVLQLQSMPSVKMNSPKKTTKENVNNLSSKKENLTQPIHHWSYFNKMRKIERFQTPVGAECFSALCFWSIPESSNFSIHISQIYWESLGSLSVDDE